MRLAPSDVATLLLGGGTECAADSKYALAGNAPKVGIK